MICGLVVERSVFDWKKIKIWLWFATRYSNGSWSVAPCSAERTLLTHFLAFSCEKMSSVNPYRKTCCYSAGAAIEFFLSFLSTSKPFRMIVGTWEIHTNVLPDIVVFFFNSISQREICHTDETRVIIFVFAFSSSFFFFFPLYKKHIKFGRKRT